VTTHGIDVSHYQRPIDWEHLGQSRYRVVVAKLSEGIGGSQLSLALECGEECRKRGMDFSVYHFIDKQLRHSAKAESANFVRLFAGVRHLCTIPPVLDVEPSGTANTWGVSGRGRSALVEWCLEWARRADVTPIIYTPAGRSYVPELLRAFRPHSPAWLSSRPWRDANGDSPPIDPGWDRAPDGAEIWQYASRVAGVPGIQGRCDRNLFRNMCALRARWGG